MRILSDGALDALAEIDAECRDDHAASDADYRAYLDTLTPEERAEALGGEYTAGDHASFLAWEAERAGMVCDGAGRPLTDGEEYPW